MPDKQILERLTTYRELGMPAVEGWFDGESAEVIAALLMIHEDTGVHGNVAEIGVHHGKSFLLLANGIRDDERAIALDVFGDQAKNVDRSGLGDRDRFEANIVSWAAHARVEILQQSSLEVDPAEAPAVFGRVRLFSIDGGHTAEITRHDLRLAEAALVEDGVVVLDDVFNPHWLGVISGLVDYLDGDAGLVPFAFSSNKLYLAGSAASAVHYATALRNELPDLLGKKQVEFLGGEIDIYGQGSRRRRKAAAARPAPPDPKAVVRLEHELAAARRRVAELTSSRSWRVTASLRAGSRLAGRVRRRRTG
ncbi:MAG TPA: class I SAM-dependent methyltransferase [Marmoricola sp.]|jgi:hypothetical protein|nr:class I SAM-dependent methyltransferase [Marmoricola sp.]